MRTVQSLEAQTVELIFTDPTQAAKVSAALMEQQPASIRGVVMGADFVNKVAVLHVWLAAGPESLFDVVGRLHFLTGVCVQPGRPNAVLTA